LTTRSPFIHGPAHDDPKAACRVELKKLELRYLRSNISGGILRHLLIAFSAATFLVSTTHADNVNVAVAANFTDAANEIAAAFAEATDHEAILSFGATGQFYTQITQGAPFEVFLAADDERPTLAVNEGHGVAGTVFTY